MRNISFCTPLLFCLLAFCSVTTGYGQTNEQKALEVKRTRLQKEINDINRLLFAERKEKGSVLDQLEALQQKIDVREQLIRVTNQQANLLNRQINANIRAISALQEELKTLKQDYALMIRKSYQNQSQESKLLFLLSSKNFYQGYKRFQYMKQYAQHRKKQGEQLAQKTTELGERNTSLVTQRKEKEALITENRSAKEALMETKESQQILLASIKKNESSYAGAIQKKKKEAKAIDKEIDRMIRAAIAAANKKAGVKKGTSSSKFVLTPENKLIADNFAANKGALLWPVSRGIISKGFGVYSDAVYPGIKHQNNGIIIATDKGEQARAIFEGEVIAILAVPGGNKGIQLKHGNYISTYYNLTDVLVKKGDKVSRKQNLGSVATNALSGKTELKFYLYKDTTKLNPQQWISR